LWTFSSSDPVLLHLHAIRLQGSAPELAAIRLPRHQCHRPIDPGSALPPLQLRVQGAAGISNAALNPTSPRTTRQATSNVYPTAAATAIYCHHTQQTTNI